MQQLNLFDQPTSLASRIADKIMVTNPDLILDPSKPAYMVKDIDKRHGGPYDRGAADSYYQRLARPHYYLGDTYTTDKVDEDAMSDWECECYFKGFEDNEASGNFKEY